MCEVSLIDVREAARRLGLKRSALYRLIQTGELPSIKVGGARRVLPADIAAFVARLRAEQVEGA